MGGPLVRFLLQNSSPFSDSRAAVSYAPAGDIHSLEPDENLKGAVLIFVGPP